MEITIPRTGTWTFENTYEHVLLVMENQCARVL